MSTTITDIITGMESQIATLLPTFSELQYKEDVQKNNLRASSDRYGVLAKASSEVPGVTKYLTFSQSFEVILIKKYYESSISDDKQVSAGLDLRDSALEIYKTLINTKAGAPAVVMNITELEMAEIEYLEEDKVAVLRSTVNITYRESLI